jgi:hypothetical protein
MAPSSGRSRPARGCQLSTSSSPARRCFDAVETTGGNTGAVEIEVYQ